MQIDRIFSDGETVKNKTFKTKYPKDWVQHGSFDQNTLTMMSKCMIVKRS